jgi:succinyl-CoA synthetase alpha subunit
VAEVTIPLPSDDTGTTLNTFLETVARRERTADAASLRHILAPESIVVITSGLDAAACADLLAVCRRHGRRLVGPDSFGIAAPGLVGLDATVVASDPRPGVAGLVMQSGSVGLAVVDQLSRLGIGISSFASVGRKLDVSSNDMLLWWEQDEVTKLAVLYIESFGNPRKFGRTARRVGARIPVLTVHAGRFAADQDPAAAGLASREALFQQVGIIAAPGLGELVETAALLATQPVPAGRTVAIVSNTGSAGALAADACADLGPDRAPPARDYRPQAAHPDSGRRGGHRPGEHHRGDFWRSLPAVPGAGRGGRERARRHRGGPAHRRHRRPDPGRPAGRRQRPAGGRGAEPGRIRAPARRHAAYAYPQAAAGAIARAATYGAWRAQPRGEVPAFPDV